MKKLLIIILLIQGVFANEYSEINKVNYVIKAYTDSNYSQEDEARIKYGSFLNSMFHSKYQTKCTMHGIMEVSNSINDFAINESEVFGYKTIDAGRSFIIIGINRERVNEYFDETYESIKYTDCSGDKDKALIIY